MGADINIYSVFCVYIYNNNIITGVILFLAHCLLNENKTQAYDLPLHPFTPSPQRAQLTHSYIHTHTNEHIQFPTAHNLNTLIRNICLFVFYRCCCGLSFVFLRYPGYIRPKKSPPLNSVSTSRRLRKERQDCVPLRPRRPPHLSPVARHAPAASPAPTAQRPIHVAQRRRRPAGTAAMPSRAVLCGQAARREEQAVDGRGVGDADAGDGTEEGRWSTRPLAAATSHAR